MMLSQNHKTVVRAYLVPQVPQANHERSAYINLFYLHTFMTSTKYKSLYEKCSKYALIDINAK